MLCSFHGAVRLTCTRNTHSHTHTHIHTHVHSQSLLSPDTTTCPISTDAIINGIRQTADSISQRNITYLSVTGAMYVIGFRAQSDCDVSI